MKILFLFVVLTIVGLCSSTYYPQRSGRGCRRRYISGATRLKRYYYNHGQTVAITCQKNYRLQGNPKITCNNGEWTKLPTCTGASSKVTCRYPGTPMNGYPKNKREYYYPKDAIYYYCTKGFKIDANSKNPIVCGENGKFSHPVPECKPILCKRPHHGSIKGDKTTYKYGEKVYYSCDGDSQLIGAKYRTCSLSGTFYGKAPQCKRVKCPKPKLGSNMYAAPDRAFYGVGEKVVFICEKGYYLEPGKRPADYCLAGPKWKNQASPLAVCKKDEAKDPVQIVCLLPKPGAGLVFTPAKDKFALGEAVKFSCRPGYRFEGDKYALCGGEGIFHLIDEPKCTRVPIRPRPIRYY